MYDGKLFKEQKSDPDQRHGLQQLLVVTVYDLDAHVSASRGTSAFHLNY